MAYPFHTAVTMKGFHQEDFHLTMNLSGIAADKTAKDVVGLAVALDEAAPNTAKLAGAGDAIIGRLASFERRTNEGSVVGAVAFRFANTLPIASGSVATTKVGVTVEGAGNGEVKNATDKDHTKNFVAEVIAAADGKPAYAVVVKF